MQSNAVVTIEELDAGGRVWRTYVSHMVRANVEGSLAAIRAAYDMNRTRIRVDGEVVSEPRRR